MHERLSFLSLVPFLEQSGVLMVGARLLDQIAKKSLQNVATVKVLDAIHEAIFQSLFTTNAFLEGFISEVNISIQKLVSSSLSHVAQGAHASAIRHHMQYRGQAEMIFLLKENC